MEKVKYKVCQVCKGTRRIKWQSLPVGEKDQRKDEVRCCVACTGGYENKKSP